MIIDGEKREQLDELIFDYFSTYDPLTPAASYCVGQLVRADWMARRLGRIEAQVLNHQIHELYKADGETDAGRAYSNERVTMANIQCRITAEDTLYHRNF